MADPILRITKLQATDRRLWIGPLDGLLKGFDLHRASSGAQLDVANMRIIEFFFKNRRIGLQNIKNRMDQVKEVHSEEYTEEYWSKGGDAFKLIRGTIQDLRKQIKTHRKTRSSNIGKFAWPNPPAQSEEILDDLLKFTYNVLQHTAVDEWWTVDAGNSTHTDSKFTKGLIDAFWMGRVTHPAWTAEKEAWQCRQEFKDILENASGTTFDYPDGQHEMDTKNPYAILEPVHTAGEDEEINAQEKGFFGSFNKHVMHRDLFGTRQSQSKSVEKILELVLANGVVGCNGERMLPNKVHKALKAFLEVRNSLQVDFYVPC